MCKRNTELDFWRAYQSKFLGNIKRVVNLIFVNICWVKSSSNVCQNEGRKWDTANIFYVIWSIITIHISNKFIFSRLLIYKNIEVSEKFHNSEHDCLIDYVIMSWLKKKAELYIHQMLFIIIKWRDFFPTIKKRLTSLVIGYQFY